MAFSFADYLGSKFQPDSGGSGTPVTNAGNYSTSPIGAGYDLGPGSGGAMNDGSGQLGAGNVNSMDRNTFNSTFPDIASQLGQGQHPDRGYDPTGGQMTDYMNQVRNTVSAPGWPSLHMGQQAQPQQGVPQGVATSNPGYYFNTQAPAGTPSYMQLKPGNYQYNNILENLVAQNGVNKNWNYGEGGEAGSPEFVRNPDGIDPHTGQSTLTPEQRQKNWEQRYYWMQNNYSQMPEKLDPNYVPLNADYNRNNPQALAQLQSIANGQGSSPGFTQEGAARQLWQWNMEKQGAGLEPGSAASPLGRYHTPDGRIFDVKTMQQIGVDPGSAAARAAVPRFSNYAGGGGGGYGGGGYSSNAKGSIVPSAHAPTPTFQSSNLLNQTPENTPGYWQAYQNYYTNGAGAATGAPTVQEAETYANLVTKYGPAVARQMAANGALSEPSQPIGPAPDVNAAPPDNYDDAGAAYANLPPAPAPSYAPPAPPASSPNRLVAPGGGSAQGPDMLVDQGAGGDVYKRPNGTYYQVLKGGGVRDLGYSPKV